MTQTDDLLTRPSASLPISPRDAAGRIAAKLAGLPWLCVELATAEGRARASTLDRIEADLDAAKLLVARARLGLREGG